MIRNFIFLLPIIFTLTSCTGHENKLPTAKPEDVGLSTERLNRFTNAMQRYIDEKKYPGFISMIARHGKIVYFEKLGKMNEEKSMEFNTIFSLQSMTKPITSVAVMMLYEEGKFQLDDPVEKYIPEFKDLKVFTSKDKNGYHVENQKRLMTIRDLLIHTSGLTYGNYNLSATAIDTLYNSLNLYARTNKDMIQKLSQIPLAYQPGTKWNYSVSTHVLGYLVEVISGKSLDEFFNERIFKPLGMEDTGFTVPEEKIDRIASLYGPSENGKCEVKLRADTSWMASPAVFLGGGSRLFSTARDYMIFAQMLLNKGEYNGVRLLGTKTVELMTKNHVPENLLPVAENNYENLGFGLGFAVFMKQTEIYSTEGESTWSGAYSTRFFIDPAEDMIWILMTHFSPNRYYPIHKEFPVLVYQAILD